MNGSTNSSSNMQLDKLSDRLDQIEVALTHFELGDKGAPYAILERMDEVASRLAEPRLRPDSLQAEQSQFEQLKAQILKNAGKMVRAGGGAKEFALHRQQRNPSTDHVWWFLDQYLSTQRKAIFRKGAIVLGAVVIVLLILVVVYRRFLAPDPALIARLDNQEKAISALENKDYQRALENANQALGSNPLDPESLILKGMALSKLGQTESANQAFAQAQNNAGGALNFYLLRAQEWLTLGDAEAAKQDAQAAIKENGKSVEGFWYRGKAEEMAQDYQDAIQDMNTAIDLANQQNQIGLVATIKTDLAILMQNLNNAPRLSLPTISPSTRTP